ncbi:MAG TPA: hypothetical protein VE569_02835 [Acidimicrobiia bacterium]|jgi:hypothetical protein|nr:hypothetical protein [Acidimicrobiia bacterium]
MVDRRRPAIHSRIRLTGHRMQTLGQLRIRLHRTRLSTHSESPDIGLHHSDVHHLQSEAAVLQPRHEISQPQRISPEGVTGSPPSRQPLEELDHLHYRRPIGRHHDERNPIT